METWWLVPHCVSTEAATDWLHDFYSNHLRDMVRNVGLTFGTDSYQELKNFYSIINKSVPFIAWPIEFNKEILLLCGYNAYDLNSAKGQFNEWQFQYFLNE